MQLRTARHLGGSPPVATTRQNLRRVHLYPEVFYFPAGGASVHHLAAEGDFTFARPTRKGGRYRMHVMRGAFERYDDETNEELMNQLTYEWPHASRACGGGSRRDPDRYGSNHIHAIPGDHGDLAGRPASS